MPPSFRSAVGELFASKKFLVMFAAVVAYVAARVGLDVGEGEAQSLLLFVAGWMGVQGLADHGKSSAMIQSGGTGTVAASNDDASPDPGPLPPTS